KDYDLDDVFSDLTRDASGRAVMSVKGANQKIDVLFGRNWRSAVVWAPKPTLAAPDRQFICFEPMAGITDAMNLSQKGLYKELQSIPPGGTWRESFWIQPTGFTTAASVRAADMEIGTWKANLAKSKYSPAELAPKSAMVKIE